MSLQRYLRSDSRGIFYYELPEGFVLYRGDSDPRYGLIMEFDDIDTEKFFGFDQETTEGQYGVTFKFETLQPLKLLALDKNNTDEFLGLIREKTDNSEILDILNNNYGYKTGTRDSVSVKDKKLCSFICSKLNDFDGYACDMMPKPKIEGGDFHAEAMICNPIDKLTIGIRITPPEKLKMHYDEWKIRKLGKEMEEQRVADKKRRSSRFFNEDDTSISPVKKSIFDYNDDTYNSPVKKPSFDYDDNRYNAPVKRLFGGNRKTKRKKTKQRKTKRNQKKTTRRHKRQTK